MTSSGSSSGSGPAGETDAQKILRLGALIRAGTTFLSRIAPIQVVNDSNLDSDTDGTTKNKTVEGLNRGATLFVTQKDTGVACIMMKRTANTTQIITTETSENEELYTLSNSKGEDNRAHDYIDTVKVLAPPDVTEVTLETWLKKFIKKFIHPIFPIATILLD